MHLRERVLLARAQEQPHPYPISKRRGKLVSADRFGVLQDPEDEQEVLGGEDSKKQGARQRGTEEAGIDGLALHHGVGVRAEAVETGRDA